MREISLFQISEIALLQSILFGVLILLAMRLFRRILDALIRQKSIRSGVPRFFPFFEAVVWFLFSYWTLNRIFRDAYYFNLMFALIIVGIFFWVFWFALRDWIAGVILKLQDSYCIGNWIKVGNLEGKIERLGLLSLEIENSEGQTVKIPYSKIAGQIHARLEPEVFQNRHRFTIDVRRKLGLEESVEQLRFFILTAPWSSTDQEPEIKLLGEDDKTYSFDVTVFAQNWSEARTIENHLRELAEK